MRFCFNLILLLIPVACQAQNMGTLRAPMQQPAAQRQTQHLSAQRSAEQFPGQFPGPSPGISYGDAAVDPYGIHGHELACDGASGEVELSRFKKQALQSIGISAGYLADLGGAGRDSSGQEIGELSSSFLDVSIGSGIPLGSFDNILGVTPRFRIDWINAANSIDIPEELYQFELQFFYRRPINERLSLMAIVSPSIRSDLTTSENAFRVFALGLLNWQCIPDRLTVSAGAVYLGRADLPVVPALGLMWTPNPMTRLDLRFPESRLSRRIAKDGGRSEKWAYLSLGLGGNTWAVTRQSSARDELSLRDFRLTVGIEKLVDGGGGWFAESGYAFGRRVEYESDESEIELADALVFQAGWRY